jgi:pimeloyl-ACP methyl ester carboxylesterase
MELLNRGSLTQLFRLITFAKIINMKEVIFILVGLISLASCKKNNATVDNLPAIKEDTVQLVGYKLETFYTTTNSKYLVVFENGMGDDHSVWQDQKVAECISVKSDILMYDRAGYGKSTLSNSGTAKNINQVRSDLEYVINKYAKGRKVILVGHSIAGIFLRNYASKNPGKLAGLFFIDPSHEKYQDSTRQDLEDLLYNVFATNFGANSGPAKEAKQFMEYLSNAGTLPNLPNIPVVVLTSMKPDDFTDQAWARTRQQWYNAHESLKNGVTDFTHVGTINAGHYIMKEEPELVKSKLLVLLSKLP